MARLPLDANLIGYWGFDEALETDNAIDLTANALHLTVTASPAVQAGRVANAREFNGTSTFAVAPTTALLRIMGDLTVIAWASLDTYNAGGSQLRSIVSCGGPTTGDGVLYSLVVTLAGELSYRHNAAAGPVIVSTAPGTIRTSQFYSVAVRRVDAGGGNQNVELYVDNVLKANATITVNGTPQALPVPGPAANASAVLSVGQSQREANSAFWDGLLDEVSVHNTARVNQPYLHSAYFSAALRAATTKLTATNTVLSVASYEMGAGVRWWCIERDKDLFVVQESPFGSFRSETRLTTVGGGNSSLVGAPELVYDAAADLLYVFFLSGNRLYKLTANSTDAPATINMPYTADTGGIIKSVDNVDGGRLGDGGGNREVLEGDIGYVNRQPLKQNLVDPDTNSLGDGGGNMEPIVVPGTPNAVQVAFTNHPEYGFGMVIGPADSEVGGYKVYKAQGGSNTPVDKSGHNLDSNAFMLWRMDEPSGTAINDIAAGVRHLTTNGTVNVVTGQIGNGRQFQNVAGNSASRAGDLATTNLFTDGSYTIEAWINLDAGFNSTGTIFSYSGLAEDGSEPNNARTSFDVLSDRTLLVEWRTSTGLSGNLVGGWTTQTVPLSTWTHVALRVSVESSTKREIEFFINGKRAAGEAFHDIQKPLAGTGASCLIQLGRTHTNFYNFAGKMDDIRVSSVARTDEEIRTSYWQGVQTFMAVPVYDGLAYFSLISPRVYGQGYFAEALRRDGTLSGIYSQVIVDRFAEVTTDSNGDLQYGLNGDGQDPVGATLGDGGGNREPLESDIPYVNRAPLKMSLQDPDVNNLGDGGCGVSSTVTQASQTVQLS